MMDTIERAKAFDADAFNATLSGGSPCTVRIGVNGCLSASLDAFDRFLTCNLASVTHIDVFLPAANLHWIEELCMDRMRERVPGATVSFGAYTSKGSRFWKPEST